MEAIEPLVRQYCSSVLDPLVGAGRFDIHRGGGHLSFGHGLHFCLGSALARTQARVAIEEVTKRWPDWEVDYDNAVMARTASVRGRGRLPVTTG